MFRNILAENSQRVWCRENLLPVKIAFSDGKPYIRWVPHEGLCRLGSNFVLSITAGSSYAVITILWEPAGNKELEWKAILRDYVIKPDTTCRIDILLCDTQSDSQTSQIRLISCWKIFEEALADRLLSEISPPRSVAPHKKCLLPEGSPPHVITVQWSCL